MRSNEQIGNDLNRRRHSSRYRETPIGLLLDDHNLGRDFDAYANARLLIGHVHG